MKNLLPFIIALTLIASCKDRKEEPAPTTAPQVSLDQTSAVPGEVISISHGYNSINGQINCSIDGMEIPVKEFGSSISFVVPSIVKGAYDVSLELNETTHLIPLKILDSIVISDPNQYLNDYFNKLNEDIQKGNDLRDSLVKDGKLNSQTWTSDVSEWEKWDAEIASKLTQLNAEQKRLIATRLEANKKWLNTLDELSATPYLRFKKTSDCEDIRTQALSLNASGKSFSALGLLPKYKWCQTKQIANEYTGDFFSKAEVLVDNLSYPDVINVVTNTVFHKIERFGVYIESIGNEEFVADDFEDIYEFRKATLTWYKGERKKVFAKIRFRTPYKSDIGTAGTLGSFASIFDKFISDYDEVFAKRKPELVWRPEFRNTSKTIDFNSHLSIPKSSITNNKVILVNTQVVDDFWEVIFATDESEDQAFSYDIVYDDGEVEIRGTYQGVVIEEKKPLAIGDFHEGGVIIYLLPSKEHGVVCAIEDFQATWGCMGYYVIGGGAGALERTQVIADECNEPNIAAKICLDYSAFGKSDWYLPGNSTTQGNFNSNRALVDSTSVANGGTKLKGDNYWTSTQSSQNLAISVGQQPVPKDSVMWVRPARTF